jgi:hypothetical protein
MQPKDRQTALASGCCGKPDEPASQSLFRRLPAIALTGADRWGRGLAQGAGVILTLHHVRPARSEGFQPNRLLEITPEFLDLQPSP